MMTLYPKVTWGARVIGAVVLTVAISGTASAQVDPARMFRGVFDSPDADRAGLVLSASLLEGYGKSPEGSLSGIGVAEGAQGIYTEVAPAISFRTGWGRHAFSLSGRTAMRYGQDDAITNIDRSLGAGLHLEFGRTAVRFQQIVSAQPFYAFNAIPSVPDTSLGAIPEMVSPEQAAVARSVFASDTSMTAGRQLGQHLWLSGHYAYRMTSVAETAEARDGLEYRRAEQRGGVTLGRQLTRRTRLRVGYELRTAGGVGRDAQPVNAHNLTVGLDRSQALTLTRHTTLSFAVGPAIVQSQNGTGVTVAGDLVLRHQLARTWVASGSMQRGLVYAAGFERPLMMNGFGLSLDGTLGRRVTTRVSYGSSRGQADLLSLSHQGAVSSTSARAGVQIGLFSHLGAFVEYWLIRQSIGEGVSSFGQAGTDYTGVRVGLVYKVPMFSRLRRGAE